MIAAVLALLVAPGLGVQAGVPLRKVGSVDLPGSASRFDYQSIDEGTGRLYLSHMGAGKLVVFDTKTDKVLDDLPGYRTVTGVLAVPEEGKVYASAAGSHEVVVSDLATNKVVARVPGARFPDGIAYAPKQRRVFVSDESGGVDLVIDAKTNQVLAKIELGGEAGNTHYDPLSGLIWTAVQTKNEMVSIDPETMKITGRYSVAGSQEPHGFVIDSARHRAYISCEGNDKLMVAELPSMKVLQTFDVTRGPDVLAIDEGLKRLYVACEGGAVEVFQIKDGGLKSLGKFSAPAAHTVSVEQKTHRVYLALQNVGGKPQMWILEPSK